MNLKADAQENVGLFLTKAYSVADDRQKMVLASSFTLDSTFELPDCKLIASATGDLESILKLIGDGIQTICEDFGVSFTGNSRKMPLRLFNTYGGMTPLDWILFFEMAGNGKFNTKYETISKNGITPEYLLSWLEKYWTKKEAAGISKIQNQPKPFFDATVAIELPSGYEEKAKKLKILEMQAETIRINYKKRYALANLKDLQPLDQAEQIKIEARKKISKFREWIILHQLQVVHQDKEYEFLLNQANGILKILKAAWQAEFDKIKGYNNPQIEVIEKTTQGFESFAAYKASQLQYSFRYQRTPQDELRTRLLEHKIGNEISTSEMIAFVTGTQPDAVVSEEKQSYHMANLAKWKVYGNTKTNGYVHAYVDYLQASIAANQVPMTKNNYLMLSVRKYAQKEFQNDSCMAFLEVINELKK